MTPLLSCFELPPSRHAITMTMITIIIIYAAPLSRHYLRRRRRRLIITPLPLPTPRAVMSSIDDYPVLLLSCRLPIHYLRYVIVIWLIRYKEEDDIIFRWHYYITHYQRERWFFTMSRLFPLAVTPFLFGWRFSNIFRHWRWTITTPLLHHWLSRHQDFHHYYAATLMDEDAALSPLRAITIVARHAAINRCARWGAAATMPTRGIMLLLLIYYFSDFRCHCHVATRLPSSVGIPSPPSSSSRWMRLINVTSSPSFIFMRDRGRRDRTEKEIDMPVPWKCFFLLFIYHYCFIALIAIIALISRCAIINPFYHFHASAPHFHDNFSFSISRLSRHWLPLRITFSSSFIIAIYWFIIIYHAIIIFHATPRAMRAMLRQLHFIILGCRLFITTPRAPRSRAARHRRGWWITRQGAPSRRHDAARRRADHDGAEPLLYYWCTDADDAVTPSRSRGLRRHALTPRALRQRAASAKDDDAIAAAASPCADFHDATLLMAIDAAALMRFFAAAMQRRAAFWFTLPPPLCFIDDKMHYDIYIAAPYAAMMHYDMAYADDAAATLLDMPPLFYAAARARHAAPIFSASAATIIMLPRRTRHAAINIDTLMLRAPRHDCRGYALLMPTPHAMFDFRFYYRFHRLPFSVFRIDIHACARHHHDYHHYFIIYRFIAIIAVTMNTPTIYDFHAAADGFSRWFSGAASPSSPPAIGRELGFSPSPPSIFAACHHQQAAAGVRGVRRARHEKAHHIDTLLMIERQRQLRRRQLPRRWNEGMMMEWDVWWMIFIIDWWCITMPMIYYFHYRLWLYAYFSHIHMRYLHYYYYYLLTALYWDAAATLRHI